jgi:MFS family permease
LPGRAFAIVFGATLLAFLAVGAVIPVLPRYVTGPLGSGDLAVGVVLGAFAATAIAARPLGGRAADRRGRRPVVLAGLALSAVAGLLYHLPLGVPGLVAARLVLGVGDGWVFTAALSWAVDLTPPARRGQAIAWFGMAIWGGLSLGPVIGEALLEAASYTAVWLFAAAAPAAAALVVLAVPDTHVRPGADAVRPPLLHPAAFRPGLVLFLLNVGYGTFAGFIVLHLAELGAGGGGLVFTAFATTVVVARLLLSSLPDRLGPRVTGVAAGAAQATGLLLITLAGGLPLAFAGAVVLGLGNSLSFPSLALLTTQRSADADRGSAMGSLTAFFDLGVGLGSPLAGAISAVAGYPAAFAVAAAMAAAGAALLATYR